jgi:hypothetical protein
MSSTRAEEVSSQAVSPESIFGIPGGEAVWIAGDGSGVAWAGWAQLQTTLPAHNISAKTIDISNRMRAMPPLPSTPRACIPTEALSLRDLFSSVDDEGKYLPLTMCSNIIKDPFPQGISLPSWAKGSSRPIEE